MTDRERWIRQWEGEYPAFVRVLKAVPAAKLDYRPHERSRSAAELVWLLACTEQAGVELIDTGKIDWKETPPLKSLDEMIAAFERNHAELATRLKKLDDTAWQRKAQFLAGGHLIMEGTVAEFLWMSLFDAVHHRGQLSVYLRPMGGKVPSIYGPSADDMGGH